MKRNFKLILCYDGTRYRGWQKQGNTDNTIQARLELLLSRVLGQAVELAGSGRTDAGVHAWRQVCPLPGGGGAPLSRPSQLPGENLCLPHLEQRAAGRLRASVSHGLARGAGRGGHAPRGGAADRRA